MAKKKQQNPKKLALMSVLIVVIWGAVFYQIFFPSNDVNVVSNQSVDLKSKEVVTIENKKYKLLKNYADPFLNEGGKRAVIRKKKKRILKVIAQKDIDAERKNFLSKLTYKGVITDKNNSTAYVVFDQKTILLSIGDTLQKNRLLLIKKDSLRFQNGKKTFWVKK
jgi:hypothetical protein